MQVTFDMSEAELTELAKMVYLAEFVMYKSSEARFNKEEYVYEHLATFNATFRSIYKMILHYLPNANIAEANELSENLFTYTVEFENEINHLPLRFMDNADMEFFAIELARRDFEEMGGKPEEAVLYKEGTFKSIYNKYAAEIKENGLKRFRIVE